jgi:hypothetical protein
MPGVHRAHSGRRLRFGCLHYTDRWEEPAPGVSPLRLGTPLCLGMMTFSAEANQTTGE